MTLHISVARVNKQHQVHEYLQHLELADRALTSLQPLIGVLSCCYGPLPTL